jgi:hypothetical protein
MFHMINTGSGTPTDAHLFGSETHGCTGSCNEPPVAYALKEQEEGLIGEIEAYLDFSFPEESSLVKERFAALKELGVAISRFPSVRAARSGRGDGKRQKDAINLSNRDSFLESLSSYSSGGRLLHLPTRVVGAHSYIMAKCQAFSMVSNLVGEIEAFYKPLRQVIFSIVCTLLAEEVYISCLEDQTFPYEIKSQLMDELVSLWDSGTELGTAEHRPSLETLWTIRDASPPSFGTMDGSSEMMRVSLSMGEDWSEFLIAQLDNPETQGALEEFLFSLSYEEIREVRSRLARFGISAINHDEIRSFLGTHPTYTMAKSTNPQASYDFYMERRDRAVYRKRGNIPGPTKTLEEMYLRFRLTRRSER